METCPQVLSHPHTQNCLLKAKWEGAEDRRPAPRPAEGALPGYIPNGQWDGPPGERLSSSFGLGRWKLQRYCSVLSSVMLSREGLAGLGTGQCPEPSLREKPGESEEGQQGSGIT